MLWEVGTNSVQLRERKNGFLVPKRHWMKHLDFLSFWLESRRSSRFCEAGAIGQRMYLAAEALGLGPRASERFLMMK